MTVMASTTTSGSYFISSRKNIDYVVSWEYSGPKLRWTAVLRDASDATKLLIGEIELHKEEASVGALVRRQVEERIDRLVGGAGLGLANAP
jgi:hypothetical protein